VGAGATAPGAHLGATLYDRADMVSMQRDAVRHLRDAHRIEQRPDNIRPLHPDDHQRPQEALQEPQREANSAFHARGQENEIDDFRRSFWQDFKDLKRDDREIEREERRPAPSRPNTSSGGPKGKPCGTVRQQSSAKFRAQ